ncbi:hypothetical protein HAX54_000333 [Datura stramonium]|uniref:Protein ENHANCED DISEASE RESISTANCE 2 C-terminal domain-containing protein n=1 Tax=Datura stramonium TaxID=4076 RepID=A0ABS8T0W7_DATST|nr:hypothetical protein [Datura stramonium]
MCSTKQKQKQKLNQHRPVVPNSTIAGKNGGGGGAGKDWREEVIVGGSLKCVDLNNGTNGWASPPGDLFNLRGQNYFTKGRKCPQNGYCNPAGVDWLRSNSKLDHVLARNDNRVMHALKKSHSQGECLKTFVLAVNLQIPGKDHHSAVFYFATKENRPLEPGSLLYQFVHGDNSYRNSRFKIVNRMIKGPWIVKTAVRNYSLAYSTDEELPEKLFGAVRICQMEMSSATFVDTTPSKKVIVSHNCSKVQAENSEDDEDK